MSVEPQSLKKELLSKYKFKIEMHAHTSPISPCSEITPQEMARLYSEAGYDAIVITNHFIHEFLTVLPKEEAIENYLSGFSQTCEAAQKLGLRVLLGAEIRFTENFNDYLIYGVDKDLLSEIYEYLPHGVEHFRKDFQMPNSVFIQAHPFRDGMNEVKTSLLDGIETFNMHPGHNSRIAIAERYAGQNKMKITTIGSDFHHKDQGHEGISALRTKTLPTDSFELAQILKSGDYLMEIGGHAIILP